MADEDKIIDVTGQPGGPSPEEQARVDAEQLELVNSIRAKNGEDEKERQRLLNEKLERADQADAARRSLVERMKLIEARLTVLENRNG